MGEDDRIGFAAAMLDELLVRIDKTEGVDGVVLLINEMRNELFKEV